MSPIKNNCSLQGIVPLLWRSAVGIAIILAGPALLSADALVSPVRDPALQKEPDWVDNRWNQTDVGPFLSSSLEVPNLRLLKAISIRLGTPTQGGAVFDTSDCSLRAAWTGGFLHFAAARYGLIHSPKPAGDLAFVFPAGAWKAKTIHYNGLHLSGHRVILSYSIDDTAVLESPTLNETDSLKTLQRSLHLAPSQSPLRLLLAQEKNIVLKDPHHAIISHSQPAPGNSARSISLIGGQLVFENGALFASFPARTKPVQAAIAITLDSHSSSAPPSPVLEDLPHLAKPAAPRWLPVLETSGQRALDVDFLAVDTLSLPFTNPWNALLFLAGVDFAEPGSAFVCSIHGDVWQISGIDHSLRHLKWKRFATGLFQPLGLKVRDGQVFVLGRDRITRLHDQNHDGEADFYESFYGLIDTAPGHNYVSALEKDDAGNFYYVDTRGVHRVTPAGQSRETLATGFRNPNGLGVHPDGKIITVAPQQGEWTPSSFLAEIKPGGFYGYGGPRSSVDRPTGFDPPLCWIPHSIDNSSGSQVWIPSGQWGLLGGQMLHLLWGRCGLLLVLRDLSGPSPQGAVVPLPGRFLSGPNRASFNPHDQSLYVAGSTGWQTSAVKDGALHRVRFTRKPIILPIAWRAHSNGLKITFTEPLEPDSAIDPGSYAVHQWNYRYASEYGSKDWSVTNPKKEGRDEVQIKSVRLLDQNKSVFLQTENDLSPAMQVEVSYNLNAHDGKPLRSQFWLTIHHIQPALR